MATATVERRGGEPAVIRESTASKVVHVLRRGPST